MTSDEYRAETLRIFGISLMVPCGTAILSIPNLTLEKINSFLIICFVLSDIRMFCRTYAASTKAPGLELKPFGVLS